MNNFSSFFMKTIMIICIFALCMYILYFMGELSNTEYKNQPYRYRYNANYYNNSQEIDTSDNYLIY